MRSRYLPISLTSRLISFKLTVGRRAQLCHTPCLTVSVLSGPASTSFSMFQSSAWLTAMSSNRPRFLSFTIRLSAMMSSAGSSRADAPAALGMPGDLAGKLSCRDVRDPHAAARAGAQSDIVQAPPAEIERCNLQVEGRREREAGSVLAAEQLTPSVHVHVGKTARHRETFTVG